MNENVWDYEQENKFASKWFTFRIKHPTKCRIEFWISINLSSVDDSKFPKQIIANKMNKTCKFTVSSHHLNWMCRYEINNRKYGTEFDINLNQFHVCFRFSLHITASHANILPIALVSMWVRWMLAEWQHMRRSVPSVARKKCVHLT